MSRQAGLALVQYLRKFAYLQFAVGEKRENPGSRHLTGGAKLLDKNGQRCGFHINV